MKIKVNRQNGRVYLPDKYLARDSDNLIQIFEVEFDDEFLQGIGQLDYILPSGEKGYINMELNEQTYSVPIYNSICKEGILDLQFLVFLNARFIKTSDEEINPNHTYYIKEGDTYVEVEHPTIEDIGEYYVQSVPLYHSKMFTLTVDPSINAELEENEQYPTKIALINAKLKEVEDALENCETATQGAEKVNISSTRVSDGVEITTTNRDGVPTTTKVNDGEKGDKGDKGDPGVPGAIKIVIVNELPTEDIDETTLYLVPKQDPTIQDLYDEYMYINNKWELLGQKQIQVDLTDYVKNTDYATSSKGGVVMINQNYGLRVSNGTLIGYGVNYTDYQSALNQLVIDKGTLENVITGKGLVSNTDYANATTGGVIKINTNTWSALSNNHELYCLQKSYADYQSGSTLAFISKGTLENVIAGKGLIDSSKIVNATSTTAGETYDVRYINTMIGDIETILTTLDIGNGVS